METATTAKLANYLPPWVIAGMAGLTAASIVSMRAPMAAENFYSQVKAVSPRDEVRLWETNLLFGTDEGRDLLAGSVGRGLKITLSLAQFSYATPLATIVWG